MSKQRIDSYCCVSCQEYAIYLHVANKEVRPNFIHMIAKSFSSIQNFHYVFYRWSRNCFILLNIIHSPPHAHV